MSRKVPNIANPKARPVRFVAHTPRIANSRMSINGPSTRSSTNTNSTRVITPSTRSSTVCGAPQPHSRPLLMANNSETSDREDPRAEHIETTGRPHRGLRNPEHHPEQRDCDQHQRKPEKPFPGEVVDDRAGQHDAQTGADAEDGREQTDRDTHLLARQLVPHDADRQREDGPGRALQCTSGDQHRQRGGQRCHQRPGEQDH